MEVESFKRKLFEDAIRHSPIDILPPELLAEIFFRSSIHEPFSPVLLSHVSTQWRCTAITTPRLWRSISATVPSQTMNATLEKVRAWLDRAGSFPIHISLLVTKWSNESRMDNLFRNLRDHSWHWGRLTLVAASYSIVRHVFIFFAPAQSPVMLSRIDLNAGLFDDLFQPPDEVGDIQADITTVFFSLHEIAAHASRLTELNISSAALPYATWGSEACLHLRHLRTLRIIEKDSQFGQIDAASVLRVLTKCPALEAFSFRGLYIFEPRSEVVNIISLHHLRELHLAQTFHQRIILSRLCTPRLEVLRLTWLNRPDSVIEDPYEAEFPDEDEDPIDYSQSPYTDILTGNGLRTLIRRSSPPLKSLDMDFSDARSPRDFLWLFTHLPLLQTFRIVGSDMSDKVLSALSVPNADGTWLCPRLTEVEFSRCDMITGRGVLALAKGRNPSMEDSITQSNCVPPARLVLFKVEACAAVDCESVALKQYVMGDVDFNVEEIPSLTPVFLEDGLQLPD